MLSSVTREVLVLKCNPSSVITRSGKVMSLLTTVQRKNFTTTLLATTANQHCGSNASGLQRYGLIRLNAHGTSHIQKTCWCLQAQRTNTKGLCFKCNPWRISPKCNPSCVTNRSGKVMSMLTTVQRKRFTTTLLATIAKSTPGSQRFQSSHKELMYTQLRIMPGWHP